MENKIKAYKEILKVVKKHSDVIEEDNVLNTCRLENIIENLSVSERFGIPLRSVSDNYKGWLYVSGPYGWKDWMVIGLYGEESQRTISWSDCGKQPKNEWLFSISFSTGAYIFGDSYPQQTFQAFFNELKSFGPKYCDSHNYSLYFSEENAKAVYDAFEGIFDKYKGMVDEELKERRKEKLKAELAKLEEG